MPRPSFQKEKPPSRIDIKLEVLDGGLPVRKELPLRLLMIGDYLGRKDDTKLIDREFIVINKSDKNINKVMKDLGIRLEYAVPDRLQEGDNMMPVALDIESMKSFHPEEVANQVPQLRRMIAMRTLLKDLRSRVSSKKEFRKQLGQLVKDPDARRQAAEALDKLFIPSEAAEESPS